MWKERTSLWSAGFGEAKPERIAEFAAEPIGSQIDGYNTAIHRADYQLDERVIPLGMKVMTRAVPSLMG